MPIGAKANMISASIMCADFCHLEEDIKELEETGVDYLHFDIMDGHFVPNFGLGLFILESIRKITSLPFDTHLMIEKPDGYIEPFVRAGSNLITIHVEACPELAHTVQLIKKCKARAGLALNPATSIETVEYILDEIDMVLIMCINPGFVGQRFIPDVLPKIEKLKKMIADRRLAVDIEVDGNINPKTIPLLAKAGANVFVGGSSGLFVKGKTIKEAVEALRRSILI